MEGFLKWFNKYLKMYVNAFYRWKGNPTNATAKLHLHSIWINYMKAGDFNPPHTHGSDLSFVIYPSIPKKILEELLAIRSKKKKPFLVDSILDPINHLHTEQQNQIILARLIIFHKQVSYLFFQQI